MKKLEKVPVFIKIDKYKELLKTLEALDAKINKINKVIEQIDNLRNEENAQLEKWKNNIESVKERVEVVSQALHQQ